VNLALEVEDFSCTVVATVVVRVHDSSRVEDVAFLCEDNVRPRVHTANLRWATHSLHLSRSDEGMLFATLTLAVQLHSHLYLLQVLNEPKQYIDGY
jgi:hypothetical protein